ncbi:MAG: TIGR04283 family arsenosugar biosynthesis glycosyltransferase [Cyanobacteria bacterium]|nr:TIGR04283 family arsenosugar biosynthesis glycosyltransferase [Cyanobacteriota bacterium]MDA1246255.1 TIGR04283 family arsenosugar biosynthesis glycosyltransferase [Cyanobacteriota bacterium]
MALITPAISVVIAARNEAPRLPLLLADLTAGWELLKEIVVVDGSSTDATARVAALAGALVLASPPGRGRQFGLGVENSSGYWLLLLHADARLPERWQQSVSGAINRAGPKQIDAAWYFDLAIAGFGAGLRIVEKGVALRSRWRQLPYGDQGLLLPRSLLQRAGGMRPLPLMEDLELAVRLRRHCQLRPLGAQLRVDGRRWQQLGVWQTALSNARLRRAWRRGGSAEELASSYYAGVDKSWN